jgi:hypothetical protein
MASAKVAWVKTSEGLKSEHTEMMSRLSELDAALESLLCYSEVYADLAGVGPAQEMAKWLAARLPDHFMREENGILAEIGRMGPDSAAFEHEMKRQHQEIRKHLESFRKAADAFQTAEDLQQSISDLKEEGKALSSFMAAHMGAEERKYAAFK